MKSGKELKQRATGLEKSQDRPKHTDVKTLQENETIINIEQETKQEQSSSSTKDIDSDIAHVPVVDALATPHHGLRGPMAHLATAQQLQDTERKVKHQATYIEDLEFKLRL